MDEVLAKLAAIERNTLLAAKNVLTIDDVALLTGISKQSIYRMTSQKKIPFSKPNGGYIFFSRKEIEDWMLRNHQDTSEETAVKAATYCVTHK